MGGGSFNWSFWMLFHFPLSFFQDQYNFEALSILLDYLSESAISPIQRDFVEVEEPYCSEVGGSDVA